MLKSMSALLSFLGDGWIGAPDGIRQPVRFFNLRFVCFVSVPSVSNNLQSPSSVNFKDPIPSGSHTRLIKTLASTCIDKNVSLQRVDRDINKNEQFFSVSFFFFFFSYFASPKELKPSLVVFRKNEFYSNKQVRLTFNFNVI